MFGSCSQPIKAIKIISCGTRDSQHGVRNSRFSTFSKNRSNKKTTTYDSPISTRVRRHTNCLRIAELEIFNIQSEQQQQRDDDLRSPLTTVVHANCLRTADLLFKANGTRDFQHSIRTAATAKETTTTRQSPLVSTIRANCLRTANLLFVEVTHLDHQMNQNQKKLMHAM